MSSVSSATSGTPAAVSTASAAPPYQNLGLASGMNDSSIIQSLMNVQQIPITELQTTVSTDQSQVSMLGTIASDLSSFGQTVDSLSKGGVTAAGVTSDNTAFTATAGTSAQPGSYSLQVTGLASAAQAMSQSFASSTSPVTGGTLQLGINGTNYNVNITDGETLSAVAAAISASGAPVNATVLNTGSAAYLSITNSSTGYTPGQAASSALTISETTTGTQGQSLNEQVTQQATNATFTLDNLSFTRTSNAVTDAIPGVTLNLSSTETSAETLTIAADSSSTQQNLQSFVSAYNQIMGDLNTVLSNGQDSQAVGAFAGDATLSALQNQLQAITSAVLSGGSGITSLSDLGITTDENGNMSLDTSTFQQAFATNPQAASTVFSQATTGVDALVDNIVTEFTAPTSGALNVYEQSLQTTVSNLQNQISNLQSNLTQYQTNLTNEFSAMESTVASLNSTAAFLNENEGLFTGNTSDSGSTGSSSSSSKVM